jgi:hypothetical protein
MKKIQIVIDTNIFISALKNDTGASFYLLSLIALDVYELSIQMLKKRRKAMKKSLFTCFAAVIFLILPTLTIAVPTSRTDQVQVINDVASPIPVYDVADKQPFQWSVMNVDFDPTQLGQSVSFAVPAGKRLVIEYVSGNAFVDIGDAVVFSVSTTVNGVLAHHKLVLTPVGPSGGFAKGYTASQSLILYADSETDVTIYVGNTLGGRATMHASISGYLVHSD